MVSSSKLGSKSISSDSSESPTSIAFGGGVGARFLDFLLCFPFLVMIEFAQDFTLRGLRLLLRFGFSIPSGDCGSLAAGEARGVSKDFERAGSDALVGKIGTELSLQRGSFVKRLRRLACTRGLGAVGEMGEIADMGRLRSETAPFKLPLMNLSNTAPAVLGRSSSSTVFSEGRVRAGCGLVLLMMDDRLFAAECPRSVDTSVSEEMVDSGRIVSILSENVTRALDGGRALASSSVLFSRSEGCETDLLNL